MKKLAQTYLVLPIVLSLGLGLAGCSSTKIVPPNISAVQTTSEEKALNENIASTMNSLATAITLDKNAQIAGSLTENDSRKIDKIWKQIEPFIEVDFDDKQSIKMFTNNSVDDDLSNNELLRYVKFKIISDISLAFVAYDHMSGGYDHISYEDLAIDYSTLAKLDSGNVLPKNQVVVEKDKSGNIISMPNPIAFVFNADGTKLIYGKDKAEHAVAEEKIMNILIELRNLKDMADKYITQDSTPTSEEFFDFTDISKTEEIYLPAETDVDFKVDGKAKEYVLKVSDPEYKGLYMSFDSNAGFIVQSHDVEESPSGMINKLYSVGFVAKNTTLAGIKEMQEQKSAKSMHYFVNGESIVDSAKIDEKNSTMETTVDGKKFIFKLPFGG